MFVIIDSGEIYEYNIQTFGKEWESFVVSNKYNASLISSWMSKFVSFDDNEESNSVVKYLDKRFVLVLAFVLSFRQ